MNKNDFRFDKTNDGRPMLIADVDSVSIDEVYDALKIMYPSRISNKGYFGAGIATEGICYWVSIDGVKINIDQDLFYVTIYPEEKGEGVKYLLEIIEKKDLIRHG